MLAAENWVSASSFAEVFVTESKQNPSPAELPAEKPSEQKPRRLRRFIIKCLAMYVVIATLVAIFQRSLLYVPFRAAHITAADAGPLAPRTSEVTVRSADGITLNGWHVRPTGGRRRTVLYCPGNAANRIHRISTLQILSADNTEVFLFDYRGYGDNEGSPTEETIASDVRQIWNWLTTDQGILPEEIIVYGQSLGGGVALRLVSDLADDGIQPAGLLLVTTFSSMVDAAKNRFGWLPVEWLLLDRYASGDRIPKVACPILLLHGDCDKIVPMSLGRNLFAQAPAKSDSGIEKQFVELTGAGHNNILSVARDRFQAEALRFLKAVRP